MVRFLEYYRHRKKFSWKYLKESTQRELALFVDIEDHAKEYFMDNPWARLLIAGHTHIPVFRHFGNGTYYLNTGTWAQTVNLDFRRMRQGFALTYAQIRVKKNEKTHTDFSDLDFELSQWKGKSEYPFTEYH